VASTAAGVRARVGRLEQTRKERPPGGTRRWLALAFLAPALVFLGALVIYPSIDTILQSLQDRTRSFVGLANYREIAGATRVHTAIKNNLIWVLSAPAIITGLGLMFAILTERVRYQTAIKIIVFMPMAISFLATGVIWRLMYDPAPDRGFMNAAIGMVADTVGGAGAYPTAVPHPQLPLERGPGGAVATEDTFQAGDTARIGLTGIRPGDMPEDAEQAREPTVGTGELAVVVWRDFLPGGGEPGVIEPGELGLPDVGIDLLDAEGNVVASESTEPDGTAVFSDLEGGPFTPRVTASTFAPGFEGVRWLAPTLVTPAIIGAFSWMWAGFAVVVIGAGLAALPRDVLEAARVDGASEWQTFRHVTLPLLAPVLGVVFITMVINVLKIFDIVLVTAPGASQDAANVIALEMFRDAFTTRQFGRAAALAVVLFAFVIPVMILNIRRFRRET
jgi:alpha-glucoside transport system permease protein